MPKRCRTITFFRNGRVIANSKTSVASTLADQPCRTGDVDPNDRSAVIDDRMKDIACGGGHPIIEELKDFLNSINQDISDFDADEFMKRFDDQKGFMNSITNLFKDFKLDFSDLDTKSLSKLLELLNKYKEEEGRVLSLIPMQAISDLDYDEITDSEVKLVFTVEDPKTNLPYTKEPVYVDISYYTPGSSVPVLSETRLSSTSGIVTFKLNPLTLPNYWTIKNLEARYKFSRGTAVASSSITLKYIIPHIITVHSGDNQFAPAGKPLGSPLSVLVKDAEGRVLPYVEVGWTVSDGTGTLSSQKTTTNAQGIASVSYTLDASTKTQTIQASAKRPNGTTVGGVTFTATIGNAFTEKLLGTWQVVKYTVYSDSDYANSVKAYAARDTKMYPDNYHFKPVGNNTVMDTSPYTITFRDKQGLLPIPLTGIIIQKIILPDHGIMDRV